jgi:hypothetical protein
MISIQQHNRLETVEEGLPTGSIKFHFKSQALSFIKKAKRNNNDFNLLAAER